MRLITPFMVIQFKVIEVGINRKPVCDFLLVINGNILSHRPTVSDFRSYRSLLCKFWTVCVFEPPMRA